MRHPRYSDVVGLVHMNGRIYDPLLGRFLSADVLVDGVADLQGYNRYSYVKNRPLVLTDPSGHFALAPAIPFLPEILTFFGLTASEAAAGGGSAILIGSAIGAQARHPSVDRPSEYGLINEYYFGQAMMQLAREANAPVTSLAEYRLDANQIDAQHLTDVPPVLPATEGFDAMPVEAGSYINVPDSDGGVQTEGFSVPEFDLTLNVEGFSESPSLPLSTPGQLEGQINLPIQLDMASGANHGNSSGSQAASGYYNIVFGSGKTYDGVGQPERAVDSAYRISTKQNDPIVSISHTTTANRAEAYKAEDRGIQANGGAGNTNRNYNERNSPGRKLNEEDKNRQ